MNKKSFFDKEVIPFSRKLPVCPKCLGRTRRYYAYHREFADYSSVLEWLKEGEYFVVICKECSYEFPQAVNKK